MRSSHQKNNDILFRFVDDPSLKRLIKSAPDALQELMSTMAERIYQLINIGTALSAERNLPKLLEMIIKEARSITNADAGTIYLKSRDEKSLEFVIVQTDSLNLRMGGTSGNPIEWKPVPLYLPDGSPNHKMVSAYVALTGKTVNIPDAYTVKDFDLAGTREYDMKTGYRSKSFLVIPMRNHENEIIGVLQLINAMQPGTDKVIPFSKTQEMLAESLASGAAISITNNQLIADLKNLFDSLVQVIAAGIDEKSPYTGGHIQRVSDLTMSIAETINKQKSGKFKDVHFNEDEMNELRIAAWLHDIGKISTPEYIVDKGTKLETIYDRINIIKKRFTLAKKELEVEYLKRLLALKKDKDYREEKEKKLREWYEAGIEQLDRDFNFLKECNLGGEFMEESKIERVKKIAKRKVTVDGVKQNLLTKDEVYNLCIPKGTLTPEERRIINNHVAVTIKMLNRLPFPKKLKNVPEIAGSHHEKLDGSGYPRGLTEEKITLQSRIMTLADIFEALTAGDRPYKKGKSLSEAMGIIEQMARERHIDPDLFELFKKTGLYRKYAKKVDSQFHIEE
jgi:HD-GYP domain-containing protein (c-di-GMP phosphodiesterase class II)